MEFKVKTIEYELIKSTKFHCLVLMTTSQKWIEWISFWLPELIKKIVI